MTGIRYSLQQSIETKRKAVGVVDAINAEDVGKFPDKNLAEALQRVPGIRSTANSAKASASTSAARYRADAHVC